METTKLSKHDQLARFFAELAEDEAMDAAWVWSNYCCEINAYERRVYCMDELDEVLTTPSEAVFAAYKSDFKPIDKWFWLDVYENLLSADALSETPYDPDELADFFIERGGDVEFFHADEIDAILGTSLCA